MIDTWQMGKVAVRVHTKSGSYRPISFRIWTKIVESAALNLLTQINVKNFRKK